MTQIEKLRALNLYKQIPKWVQMSNSTKTHILWNNWFGVFTLLHNFSFQSYPYIIFHNIILPFTLIIASQTSYLRIIKDILVDL